jgi:hypothetical protein
VSTVLLSPAAGNSGAPQPSPNPNRKGYVRAIFLFVCLAAVLGLAAGPQLHATQAQTDSAQAQTDPASLPAPALVDAQRLFYNGRYEAAAALALALQTAEADNLEASELRTSAILFQLRRAIGEPKDKEKALKQCDACADLMAAFMSENAAAQTKARAMVKAAPADDRALFLLGKLDLNYVWLQLGTLGRRTGWSEYWEARKSLDTVLERQPRHVRARVARAWIDYIVDTRMPIGTKWLLGGGNRKKALSVIREAATQNEDFFTNAEAAFALWDIQIRERNLKEAVVVARVLAQDFPDNVELIRFLEANASPSTP